MGVFMFKLFTLVIFIGIFSHKAVASERFFTCKIFLQENTKIELSTQLVDGEGMIHYPYKYLLGTSNEKEYSIEAMVWGFKEGASGRKSGYLSIKEIKKQADSPVNYAINHCEKKSAKEGCALELLAILNGVGFHVECELPEDSSATVL